jgi:hypothetical protein
MNRRNWRRYQGKRLSWLMGLIWACLISYGLGYYIYALVRVM